MPKRDVPTIGELMTGNLITLRSVDTVDRARQTINDTGLHALPIIDDDRTVGVITLADCEYHSDYEHLGDIAVLPPTMIDIEATVGEAAELMRTEHIHHLLVTKGNTGEAIGILSSLDLLYALTL